MRSSRVAVVVPPAAVTVTAIWSTAGQTFDASAIAGFGSLPQSWSQDSGRLIRAIDSYLAPNSPIKLAVGVVVIGLLVWRALGGSRRPLGWSSSTISGSTKRQVALGAWITGGAAVVVATKQLLVRPQHDDVLLVGNSLPSGHTYAFFAVATGVAAIAALWANAPLRLTVEAFAGAITAWALLILISTGHRPSDVIVALLIGQAVTAMAAGLAVSRLGLLSAAAWVLSTVLASSLGWTTNNASAQVGSAALSLAVVLIAAVGVAETLARAIPSLAGPSLGRAGPPLATVSGVAAPVGAVSRYSSMPKNSL